MIALTGKYTIYVSKIFGYEKVEVTDIEYGLVEYAQYCDAVRIDFLPKRKRLRRRIIEGFKPKIVILEGWGHPDPAPMYEKFDSKVTGVEMFVTRKSGDPSIETDFTTFLKNYIDRSKSVVIIDYRGFEPKMKQNNVYSKSLRNRLIATLIESLKYHKA